MIHNLVEYKEQSFPPMAVAFCERENKEDIVVETDRNGMVVSVVEGIRYYYEWLFYTYKRDNGRLCDLLSAARGNPFLPSQLGKIRVVEVQCNGGDIVSRKNGDTVFVRKNGKVLLDHRNE